jgi:hypothetical protein
VNLGKEGCGEMVKSPATTGKLSTNFDDREQMGPKPEGVCSFAVGKTGSYGLKFTWPVEPAIADRRLLNANFLSRGVTPCFLLFGKNKPAQARNSENTAKAGRTSRHLFCEPRVCDTRRNYRKRFGEIDIIAEIDNTLVFVEVKTRTSTFSGRPFEAVDCRKQQRMIKAALNYINVTPFSWTGRPGLT